MADQDDDTLIDMPLLDEVLDDDDDDDGDDGGDNNKDGICEKGLIDKLKVAEKPLTLDSGGGGGGGCEDSEKPMENTDSCDSTEQESSVKGEEEEEVQESGPEKLESDTQTESLSDTTSSESSNDHSLTSPTNNNNNNNPLKSEAEAARRLSGSSTTTPTSSSDGDIADGAPTYHRNDETNDNDNSNSNHNSSSSNIPSHPTTNSSNGDDDSSSSLNTNTRQLQEHPQNQPQCEHSVREVLDGFRTQSESDIPGETSRQISSSAEVTRGSVGDRGGSTSSSRLLSSDSDLGYSQESLVTFEVIPLPRVNAAAFENARQDSAVSVAADSEQLGAARQAQQEVEEGEQGQRELREEEASTPLPNAEQEEEEEVNTVVEETEVVEMSDQQRLEEKLRQFENDAKEREKDANRNTDDDTVQISELEKQRRRNLIFDEERFEETFLKCLICREVYNETDKLPKMLHCHHTFCMDCLYQMYRVEGEFRQSLTSVFRNMPLTVKIQCPTCREGIIISEAELRRLPNDHTIMELLCFVNKTGKNDVQYCPKHQMQPLNFFCEPCIMPVCCDCTVLDHKESKGHRVVNVDEAMKKYAPIVEDTLTDIRKEKTTLGGKRETLENTREDLNRIQSGISDQIRKVFDSIREVLDERERELHDVAVAEVDRKQGIIEGHLNTIADRESDLNAEFNSLQMATDDKDISLIFTGHKSARDLLARKVFIPTNSTAGFSITFQFSSRADTVIKQQVANLGDVIFHS